MENEICRIWFNNEIMNELSGENIVGHMRVLMIKWLGHIHRKKSLEDVRSVN